MTGFQPAVKTQLRARVALAGPTGSGKTWTALEWAEVLGERIAVIDTERGSARYYANRFSFDVLDWPPPYSPQRLVETLEAAQHDYDVIVIDSFSHFWEGEGGVLDVVDAAASRFGGNSFAGWKIGTPVQRHVIDTMLGIDAHLIVTMRSKMEYVLDEDKKGKTTPRRVGMAPVQRAGVEYEFTIVGDLDLEHRLVFTKSRCDLLADQVIQPGRAAEAAQVFAKWLDDGVAPASPVDIAALTVQFAEIPDADARRDAKEAFIRRFGHPDALPADRLAEAQEWMVGTISEIEHDTDPTVRAVDGGGGLLLADDGPSPTEDDQ